VAGLRVSRHYRGIAVVYDLQDGERIDAEIQVPSGGFPAALEREADRAGAESRSRAVARHVVHRRANDRNVDTGERGRVEHERQLLEGR